LYLVFTIIAVRRDYFDSILPQFGIELIGVVGIVSGQILRSFGDNISTRVDSTSVTSCGVAVCHGHDLVPLPRFPTFRPPFGLG
jgi:hypothetical protein